ncbi:hypothetical protein BX616_009195, partial [Lobosporangium transversale]
DPAGDIVETHFTHVSRLRWCTMTRIDYIMVSHALLPTVSSYKVSTMPIIKTDHRIVEVVINTSKRPNPPPRPMPALPTGNDDDDEPTAAAARNPAVITKPVLILDTRILRDPAFQTEIRSLISRCLRKRASHPTLFQSAGEFWDDCKKKCLFAGLRYRKKKRFNDTRERIDLQKTLKEADLALDNQPNDPDAISNLFEAREQLRKHEA